MDAMIPQRPQHRRQASSKSNILRSLVSPRARNEETQIYSPPTQGTSYTQKVPVLPPDHPHGQSRSKSRVLGERQGNVQSPPSSPCKSRQKSMAVSKTSNDLRSKQEDRPTAPKKSKSSTNLGAVFARMNRSSKDLSMQAPKDKENTTPPSSAHGQSAYAPIWESLNTTKKNGSRPSSKDGELSKVEQEIARYTPQEYSPSKQRNFNGGCDEPRMRPTLSRSKRPQSEYIQSNSVLASIGRRVSGDRTSFVGSRSEEIERRKRTSVEENTSVRDFGARKTSGSSTEGPAKEKLNISKRGGRVMAAVAAFQGKGKDALSKKDASTLDSKAIEHAFEEVLASRNVPETTRQKMRSMTLTVKADFIEKNQGFASSSSPTDGPKTRPAAKTANSSPVEQKAEDNDAKATKRSRARSRTFTFSKGDKKGDVSPSKKRRSQSRGRQAAEEEAAVVPSTPHKSPRSSLDKKSGPTVPADFITYLRKHQDPAKLEVGRMHKLRILLRNETVAWVDAFISLGGMTEIVDLLHRVMAVEWREEHEDSLLHETLNCLKGLCTTERAMAELDKVADELFPALIAMLFDDEKKGPAEYATRTIITSLLFNYLASAKDASSPALESRAQKILTYLSEPSKPDTDRPVDFVLHMHAPRPYKLWSREVSNVTREVFWIFLHHLNVVPLPRPASNSGAKNGNNSNEDVSVGDDPAERAKALEALYTTRHFPGSRPPVPAAPYIGGVEWDATTYITSHLDLLNGLLASLPTATMRNELRSSLRVSGFEKVLGTQLRTCKEKFYAGVHDALRAWVAAASEDGWDVRFVREGPTLEEAAMACSPRKGSPKKAEQAPKLDVPHLNLDIGGAGEKGVSDDGEDGWLG